MTRVVKDGKETDTSVEEVQVSDIMIVKPSEKIPIDRTVTAGYSSIDEKLLTGESIPVEKTVGRSYRHQKGPSKRSVRRRTKQENYAQNRH
jgi:P-type E1-E2 ATPase